MNDIVARLRESKAWGIVRGNKRTRKATPLEMEAADVIELLEDELRPFREGANLGTMILEVREENRLLKSALATKDFALIAAAGERAWLIGLIDKLPTLDLTWPDNIQAMWWKHFEAMKARADKQYSEGNGR